MVRMLKPLKVSTPEGKRIYANVFKVGDQVTIEVSFLEQVKKDAPPFANNGVIRFKCEQKDYVGAMQTLTKYLEDLFLKGMVNENIRASFGSESRPERDSEQDLKGEARIPEGEGDTSGLHPRARGRKQAKSDSVRHDGNSAMAEGGDS